MRTLRWWLKWSTLKERLWEPVHKQLFLARQLRTERDYWKEKALRLESPPVSMGYGSGMPPVDPNLMQSISRLAGKPSKTFQ